MSAGGKWGHIVTKHEVYIFQSSATLCIIAGEILRIPNLLAVQASLVYGREKFHEYLNWPS